MTIEDGIAVLMASQKKNLTMREAVELIELITRNPDQVKKILKKAEQKGFIKREGLSITISEDAAPKTRPIIRKRDCDSSCRRCGLRIKNCHFIDIDDRSYGPYGSSCVRKILP